MKTWNKTDATDITIVTGSSSIDRVSAQFYNAHASADVEVTIKANDAVGGEVDPIIIKKFTLVAGETNHYHVNELETSDTVTVVTGAGVNLNIVTWN